MKNGFTKFQNVIITEVKEAMKKGSTLQACSVLIGVNNGVSAEYVEMTFNSYKQMEIMKK